MKAPLEMTMKRLPSSIRTGIALSITVGVGYALCSVFFWLWPDAAVTLTNALFHGFDFRRLQGRAAVFDFGSFCYVLLVMMAWAFILGALFAWIARALDRAN